MRNRTGFWRKCRVVFRHFRRLILVAVVVLIGAVVWLNQIGLPDFVKRPLVETLRARGIELEFARLRLSFLRGLVASDVRVGETAKAGGPILSLHRVQLRLDYRALLHRQLQIDGLTLQQGKLVWPLSPTNSLELDRIQSDLRFAGNDTWSLDNFRANFAGVNVALSGDIRHARALRDWPIFHGHAANSAARQVFLERFASTLHQLQFTGIPQFSLVVNGDALDPGSFRIHLSIAAPSADTPWGSARAIQLAARLVAPTGTPVKSIPTPGAWTNLQPYEVAWTAQLAELRSERLNAQSIRFAGFWRAPWLVVTNLSAELGGGRFSAGARLQTDTRELSFSNSSCFDPRAIAPLLTEKTQNWLKQFSWTQPPAWQAAGSLILPAWTNRQPDWRGEVQPTIRLIGSFSATNGAFRGIAVDEARGAFSYSNMVWQLSPLLVRRPEGALSLADSEDDRTKNFHWHVQGALSPDALQPLLAENHVERALKPFTFTQPLCLNADVWGRLNDNESLGAAGSAALTNFTVHGETVGTVESAFRYTNRFLEFFQPRLQAGAQRMSADGVALDFKAWRVYFTNGFSTADPRAVARAIGPKQGEVMEPYRFGVPCRARVNGYAPLRGSDDADIWFEGNGASLQWLRLKTPRITGKVHWLGETLVLTNLAAELCGGTAAGFAHFDFHPRAGADFDFTATVANADVHLLAADLSSPTNHLEGWLSGRFVMTSANSRDWQTWNGYGEAYLHDGLIWDVPIFGVLSPVLNAVMPGLGSSRATDASARFDMTNGVMFSDDLNIRTTMMRLQYNGTVDLRSRVQARVTAQLLRDTWVVGPVLSTALWPVSKLFEYKIGGTLQRPRTDPVYIPRVLLTPLHPLRSLQDILYETNSPGLPLK